MAKGVLFIGCLILWVGCQRKMANIVSVSEEMDVVANKIDTSVNPADDFYEWANGGWFKAFPMPPTESKWGMETMVNEEVFQNTINFCRNASVNMSPIGSIEQKIGDLWATGMDTIAMEAQGLIYIQPLLDSISGINDLPDFFSVMGQIQTYSITPLLYPYVYQDKMQSDQYALYIYQGSLGLYEKEYYLTNDDMNPQIRKAYLQYLKKIFLNMGESDRTAFMHATCVFKIEKFLAQQHKSLDDLSGPYESYNKFSVADLEKMTPSVSWQNLLQSMNVTTDSVVIEQIDYIKSLDTGFSQFALEDWKCYLRFWVINSLAAYLPKKFSSAQFDFYGKVIDGRQQKKPQWKFLLENEERFLGDGLGRLFVKDFFSEKSKQRYSDMVEHVRVAFAETINELTWMSDDTKQHALYKLSVMKKKIGYPTKWKDFAGMKIDKQSYVKNILNAKLWWFKRDIAKLQKSVDRTDWNMTPQEYNAYYSPANNEIVISAAVLTIPGFEDAQIDDAVAFGYVASATIGHEMVHAFDMEGKEYDMNGNLKRWWTSQDSANYVKRALPLIEQYDNYIAVDTLRCRGEATWNENISDLGGVTVALKAFKKTQQFKEGNKIAGYTPLQRFFMGYALGWMTVFTKERLKRKVMTDDHAPPKWRVNGVLSNIPEFYEAFNVKSENKMWIPPAERVKIW
jgi:putative endopeptidase